MASPFPLMRLCDDLLLCVADLVDSDASLSSLARTNIRLLGLLNQYLYRRNARVEESSAIVRAIEDDLPRNALLYGLDAYRVIGSQVKLKGHNGRSLLADTLFHGYESVCTLLVKNGHYDMTELVNDHGQMVLSAAAMLGYVDIAKILLKVEGVDVNQTDLTGKTPLFWAARRDQANVVRLLVEQKDIEVNATDRDRETPLVWACRRGFGQVVKALLSHSKIDPNMSNHDGQTPLSEAIRVASCADVVRQLLQHNKTDVNLAMPRLGMKEPIFLAASSGHFKIVKLLVQDARLDVHRVDQQLRTALSLAAGSGHAKVMSFLIASTTIDVNSVDASGMNALHHAMAQTVDMDCAVHLLKHPSVKPNAADTNGHSALFHAVNAHNINAVRILLKTPGVDINHKDKFGCCLLIWSVCRPWVLEEILELFLRSDHLDVNAEDSLGYSALTWCCKLGLIHIVRLLLARPDIDIDAKDTDGFTPQDWARRGGNKQHAIIALLKKHRKSAE